MKLMTPLIIALAVFGTASTSYAESEAEVMDSWTSDDHREFNLEAGLSMGGPAGWENIGLEVEILEALKIYGGLGLSYNDDVQYALMARGYLRTNDRRLRIGIGAGGSAGSYEFVQGQNNPIGWLCGAFCGSRSRYENDLAFWGNAEVFVGPQLTERFALDALVGYSVMLNPGDNRCTSSNVCFTDEGTHHMYVGIRASFDINPMKR